MLLDMADFDAAAAIAEHDSMKRWESDAAGGCADCGTADLLGK
jgi:hypothetical protein